MTMVGKFTYTIKDIDDGLWYVEGKFSDGNNFDLDVLEVHGSTTAMEEQIHEAMKIADELWMDALLGSNGRRNNDAVNLCIALHVLGIDDVCQWMDAALDKHAYISRNDWSEFYDHVQRVSEYLCAWGPDNDMGRALDKVIR